MAMRVITVDVTHTVFDAAEKMIKRDVGCIVVTEDGDIVGIVTKGDILRNSLLKIQDPKKTLVGAIMSKPVITISPESSLEEAAKLMSQNKVSKLPVLDNGLLVGIITSTDIIKVEPQYVEHLKDLIAGKSSQQI
jgi:CBS domain-containing protein